MEKELIFENSDAIDNLLMNIRNYEDRLLKLKAEFDALNLDTNLDISLLPDLIHDPDGFVKKIYMDKIPDYDQSTKLPVNKQLVLNTVHIPNLRTLRDACLDCKHGIDYLPFFTIDGGTIEISSEKLEQKFNSAPFRYFTDSIRDLALWQQWQRLADELSDLNKKFEFLPQYIPGKFEFDISELFTYRKGQFSMKPEAFMSLIRKLKLKTN